MHNGEGAPTVRLRWMFTDLPFPPVGSPSVITNRIWDEDQSTFLKVGQYPLAIARYHQDERWRLPPGLTGKHQCNPQWFATGEPWPTDLPPTEYGLGDIPICCFPEANPVRGGIEVGGKAGDKIAFNDPTYGGIVVGGAAGDALGFNDPTYGGIVVGGEGGELPGWNDPTYGGIVVGGAAGDVFTPPERIDPTAGGIEVGGAAGDVFTPGAGYVDPAAGGIEVGGAAGDARRYNDPTYGGIVVGGAAGDVLGFTDPTAGGIEVGGAAGDVFSGGGPVPGDSCTSAGECVAGTGYDYTTGPIANTDQWFKFPVSGSGRFHITATNDDGNIGVLVLSGTSCSAIIDASFNLINSCQSVSVEGASWVFVNFSPFVDTDDGIPYHFSGDTGDCP